MRPVLFALLFVSTATAADPRVGLRPAHGIALDNRIESLSPPVVERGKTTRVTFVGRDFGEVQDLWCSLSGSLKAVPVESKPSRVVMDITASADAPVGVCGVRLATRDGLSNAALLLVDDLPGTRWGTFREGTVDRYPLQVKAGESVSLEVVANRLGKDADPLVTIRDANGKRIAEHDNDPGLYFDCRFEHRFESAGTYTVEVRDARFKASEHHHYVLRMGKFPAERVASPPAIESGFDPEMPRSQLGSRFVNRKRPGDDGSSWVPIVPSHGPVTVAEEFDEARDTALSQAASGPATLGFMLSPGFRNPFLPLDRHFVLGRIQATPAVVPGSLCGVLRTPGRSDAFQLRLAKGERIFVRGEARSLNSPADLELALVDKTGREQRRTAENTGTREEAAFDFTAPETGRYALIVRDAIRDGSPAHAYRIAVRHTPFPPQLTAEVEGLIIPQGTYQPIPIIVNRNGTSGPIKLYLVGAPAGVKLTPDEIGEKDASVVCRLEAADSAPLGIHTVQIVAEVNGERTLVKTQPLIDMKWQNVDLIPIALREDQTRLPPSLADRFAVQITPPAPFAFEVSEKEILLPRYQKAAIPLAVSRAGGFAGPISFEARGGQLAEKNEGRTRVYAEFPEESRGEIVSKILSNTGRTRIEVIGSARDRGRRVQLIRTFQLDLTTAFTFAPEPVKVALLPGESARARIAIQRLKSFDGPVLLHLQPQSGVSFPETVLVPKGQSSVEIEIAAAADTQPRKQGLTAMASGEVDGFEEEVRGSPIEIEVKKPEPKKK